MTKQEMLQALLNDSYHHLIKTYNGWQVYDDYSFELNFPNWENNPDTPIHEHYTSEDVYACQHCDSLILVSDDTCDNCGNYPHPYPEEEVA